MCGIIVGTIQLLGIGKFEEERLTIDELKQNISEGRYEIDISPKLNEKVAAAKKMKKILKESMSEVAYNKK